jgi:error-prone DNA polymerase
VIQWNKDDLDELGILKVDCLSLGMLTAIRKSFELIERHHGRRLTLADVPREDPAVYDMICRADTMGVFQIESRAQMSMLPRLKPRCYYDLVIEVAIVRPGPIQGQMVHPYLRRRAGEEEVTYPSEAIREVLEKTLGVPLFQEQAMRLAVVAAGFTPGEADQLRRAMGAWRRPGIIDRFECKLIEGMLERGLSRRFAEQVFRQIRGFGEYGFPESHAASFAQLVYVSAWLKRYYPDVFVAALLNSQPMGFYAPAQLVRDARDHRVEVRGADVGHSRWDCTLEQGGTLEQVAIAEQNGSPPRCALRLGFRLLAWLSPSHAEAIERARDAGPFRGVADFARRTGLSRMVLEHLARADAFGSLGQSRRSALWHVLQCGERLDRRPLFMTCPADDEPAVALPEAPLEQEVFDDYRASGLSLRAHPLSFCRPALDQMGVLPAGRLVEMSHNRSVRVGGLVLLRQRPSTARGITFVTLEDETGIANLVVRQEIWERYARVARHASAWIAHGRLERKESIIHILVGRLEDLSARLRQLRVRSRDFR